MLLESRIAWCLETNLIGIRRKMSFAVDETPLLWRGFMPRRREIGNRLSEDLYSLQVYGADFDFAPHTVFEKWALAPVPDFSSVPEGMETFVIPAGKYVVFNYCGKAGDSGIFTSIFTEWLPRSGYALDDRPHFEILGELYSNHASDSEEEIWIPISQGILK